MLPDEIQHGVGHWILVLNRPENDGVVVPVCDAHKVSLTPLAQQRLVKLLGHLR
jgi:hypothetical protein